MRNFKLVKQNIFSSFNDKNRTIEEYISCDTYYKNDYMLEFIEKDNIKYKYNSIGDIYFKLYELIDNNYLLIEQHKHDN